MDSIEHFRTFDAAKWFWIVAGDESRAWSSEACAYVENYPMDRITRIVSEAELTAVLRPYGLQGPAPTQKDYADAVQRHVDETAQARGYLDGVTCASYSASTAAGWVADAAAFVAWRDAVWASVLETLAAYEAGQITQPRISAVVAALPEIEWPG
jgi:hypothetical protein